MYLMLQQKEPEDFVIATGESHKLEEFVAATFEAVGLDWKKFTKTDPDLMRPTEIMIGRGDAFKAATKLGWKAKYRMPEVARLMVEAAISPGVRS
jgi:GDPmannose 4,6-dehydratase